MSNSGTFNVSTDTRLSNALTQTAGSTTVAGGVTLTLTAGTVQLQGGVLAGGRTVAASVGNTCGNVTPGTSPGLLTISGSYTQGAGGTLTAEITGTTVGTQYDRLAMTGTATLGGTLAVQTSGFTPTNADTFTILTASSVGGTFATRTFSGGYAYTVTYNPASVTLGAGQPTAVRVLGFQTRRNGRLGRRHMLLSRSR